MMLDSRGMVRYAPTSAAVSARIRRRQILYRDFVPISIAVAPDMFREMQSTSDILFREGIEHIDKAPDGNLYAFSRSFPRGVDVTMLWRQLYGAMARVSRVPSQEIARIEMPTNVCIHFNMMMGIVSTNQGRVGGTNGTIIITVTNLSRIWLLRCSLFCK
ncbi:hypothetical protein EDD85DRAFT_341386 [Armillaria nabsnona]|nr:hypothetical protein EDD85DRAFT_341386 [Armillaria nabsnona]